MQTFPRSEQRRSILAALLLLSALALAPSDAEACSYFIGPGWFESTINTATEPMPAGSLVVFGSDDPTVALEDSSGQEVGALERDAKLSLLLQGSMEQQESLSVYRIASDQAPGTYKINRATLEVTESVEETPGDATLTGLRVTYVTQAQGDRTGAECPELDQMFFKLSGATSPSYITAFVADTAEEVAALEEPNYWLPGPPTKEETVEVSFVLGSAVGHYRSGLGLNREKLCFSLAWMDTQGAVGARTDVTCLSTVDPNDPLVEPVRSDRAGFAGCASTGSQGGPGSTWPLAILGLMWAWRRRRA